MLQQNNFLWVEKYRPRKVSDTILPQHLKSAFQSYVDDGKIPNLLLSGSSGVGKTTVAMAMCDELDADYLKINGSLEGRLIDTLRTTIIDFASTVSINGGRKYVILDEADNLNPTTVQPALRGFIEEFASNCGFILTCNYRNKIKPAIISRCSVVEFKNPKEEAAQLAASFLKRTCEILTQENVGFDKKVVAQVIKKYYPDWRRTLNELQKYSKAGQIDTGIFVDLKEIALDEVVGLLKARDFKNLRKWVAENNEMDPTGLFQTFYEHGHSFLKGPSVPLLVLLMAKYQYQSAFVANQDINTMAFFVDVMTDCEFQ